MPRLPCLLLCLLVALSIPTALPTALPTTTSTALPAAAAAAPGAAAEGDAPLELRITEMTPSVLRDDSDVVLQGTVTNVSDDTWTTINVHSFHGLAPITDAAGLAVAADSAPDEYVGERVVDPGTFVTIPTLAPGESASFTATIPAAKIPAVDGVYWAGVHAMGVTEEQPSDTYADGRARTFLPVVTGRTRPLPASLVLPLRAAVHHRPDGSVANAAAWARRLGPGGRLHNLLEAGRLAGDRPVTWLVDPAVPHTAARLAAGNPARTIEPLPGAEEGDEPGEGEADPAAPATEDPASPSPSPTEPADPEDVSPAEEAAATAAEAWLATFTAVMADHPVLALPYGDVDVSAVHRTEEQLYERAAQRSAEVMTGLGIAATPALSAPRGYLSPDAIRSAVSGTLVLLTDEALVDPAGSSVPSTGTVLGHAFATTSSGVAEGGPGPEPAGGPVAVRQRVLSEAALQLLSGDRSPLVMVPPPSWDPSSSSSLYESFDGGLLRLRPLGDVVDAGPDPVPDRAVVYGEEQAEEELPADNVHSAARLVESARLLDDILARPSGVVTQVGDSALTDISYFARRRPDAWRLRTIRSRSALTSLVSSVRIDGPPSVTLTSDEGTLGFTLSNDLDVPVIVNVVADEATTLEVVQPEPVHLAPRSRRRLLIDVSTRRQGIQSLTMRLTDGEGVPLGSAATVSVRIAQVSGLLWIIMGVGFGMLFGAIAVRLFRRVRAARREADG